MKILNVLNTLSCFFIHILFFTMNTNNCICYQIQWWNLHHLKQLWRWYIDMPSPLQKISAANHCSWVWASLVGMWLVFSAPSCLIPLTISSRSLTMPRVQLLVMWVLFIFIHLVFTSPTLLWTSFNNNFQLCRLWRSWVCGVSSLGGFLFVLSWLEHSLERNGEFMMPSKFLWGCKFLLPILLMLFLEVGLIGWFIC